MFELIADFIDNAIRKIMEKGIDMKHQDLLQRQSLFSVFFRLYRNLLKYEKTIKESIIKMHEFRNGEAILLKSKVESLVRSNSISYNYVMRSLRQAHFVCSPMRNIKTFIDYLPSIDLIPKQELSERGGITYYVSYPTKIPPKEEVQIIRKKYKKQLGKSANEQTKKQIENDIFQEIKPLSNAETIDFRNNADLEKVLPLALKNLETIGESKVALAKFIRENFDLKDFII